MESSVTTLATWSAVPEGSPTSVRCQIVCGTAYRSQATEAATTSGRRIQAAASNMSAPVATNSAPKSITRCWSYGPIWAIQPCPVGNWS